MDSKTKTCTDHRVDVFGKTNMKELAEEICNLRYDAFADLMDHMETKLMKDAAKDKFGGRKLLADVLYSASFCFSAAHKRIRKAWDISKKFM